MPRSADAAASPVTADDLDQAVRLAVAVLRAVPAAAWDGQAGSLEWDCWETVEHISDALFSYAATLGPRTPPLDADVPFEGERRRPGGPDSAVHANRAAGPAGLVLVLEACAGLLVAMVRTTPPQVRAYHSFGVSDPAGFAAMGVVETLVHTHDVAEGLGLGWVPPAGLCSQVLTRLFPDAPPTADPWPTLLWATGRAELPGRPRLTAWRWTGTPRSKLG